MNQIIWFGVGEYTSEGRSNIFISMISSFNTVCDAVPRLRSQKHALENGLWPIPKYLQICIVDISFQNKYNM